MKALFRTTCLLIGLSVVSTISYSQINVSRTDFEKIFKIGSGVSLNVGSIDSINIGQPGGPHIYDFSKITFDTVLTDTPVNAGSIPKLNARFPSNALALVTGGGTEGSDYALFMIDDIKCAQPGNAFLSNSGLDDHYSHSDPYETFINLPISYNTDYTQTATHKDTTYMGGSPHSFEQNVITVSTKIDGYGTLMLPGHLNFECLRVIKQEDTPYQYKSYGYYTREGIALLVETRNDQPDTGKVKVYSNILGLYGDGAGTFVSSTKNDLQVKIHPNPSSGKVFIDYTLRKNSPVSIYLIDIQGRKIREIKNDFSLANSYQITEDISELNSGMYFISVLTKDAIKVEKLFLK
jgi:hypothetical protein